LAETSKQNETVEEKRMTEVGGIQADQLASYVERIERLEEEKSNLMTDIKEVYGEAKALGYDVKILREIIRLRKMEDHERTDQEEILEVYKRALGMA
tara:strand:- start:32688 stop:32978 length:291 start_codon:yes stop_codon:yes gene_type:complete